MNALREVFQTRPGVHAAGIPKSSFEALRRKLRTGQASRGGADGAAAEIELRNDGLHLAIEVLGGRSERLLPRQPLLIALRFADLDRKHPLL